MPYSKPSTNLRNNSDVIQEGMHLHHINPLLSVRLGPSFEQSQY